MSRPAELTLTPVEALLLECISSTTTATRLRQALVSSELNWRAFWDLAGHQHVRPLVARALSGPEFENDLPSDALPDLRAVRLETVANNLALRTELSAIASLLHDKGIPVIPLKGVGLAQRLFGGLDARRCGDIDILVREPDWHAANEVLVGYGYRAIETSSQSLQRHPFHGLPLQRESSGRRFVVELHHQLSDPRLVNIDHDALWRRVLAEGDREECGYAMPAEDLLLFLSLHLPKHDAGMLRLVADIDRLVVGEQATLDWNRVTSLAVVWQVQTLLYFSLEAAAVLLGTPVPESVRQRLRPSWWRRVVVPALAGPPAILRPPASAHLRSSRFRIAYCLMLTSYMSMFRAYWNDILALPARRPGKSLGMRIPPISRPAAGIARTSLAVASAIGDRWSRNPQRLNS